MKTLLKICLILLLVNSYSFGQNLVPNPSFETFTNCPSNTHQIVLATPWNSPYANGAQAEYFNICAINSGLGIPFNFNTMGYQISLTGSAYAGFETFSSLAFIRQFLQVKLTDTMEAGKYYCLTFYVNLINNAKYGVDGIGAYFSDTLFNCNNSTCLIGLNPQVSNPAGNAITDTLNWTLISGCFTANGTESYLLIGNFLPDSLTTKEAANINSIWSSFYYIDDVSLTEDTSLQVSSLKKTYTLYVNPNPASNYITIKYTGESTIGNFWIENLQGQVIKSVEINNTNSLIPTSDLSNGAYVYKCKVKDGVVFSGKLLIVHQ